MGWLTGGTGNLGKVAASRERQWGPKSGTGNGEHFPLRSTGHMKKTMEKPGGFKRKRDKKEGKKKKK